MAENIKLFSFIKKNQDKNNNYESLPPEKGDDDESSSKNRSGILGVTINTTNSILGSGIIGIPYGFKTSGLGLGIVFLIIGTLISNYTLKLILIFGNKVEEKTYTETIGKAYGKRGWWIGLIVHFVFTLGVVVLYLVALGDGITRVVVRYSGEVFVGTPLVDRRFIMFLVVVLILLPLSLYRNLHKFRYWSLIGIFCVVFLIVFMLTKLVIIGPIYNSPTSSTFHFAEKGALKGLSVIIMSLICHQNTFVLANSMENRNDNEWKQVVDYSYLMSIICILVFAIFSYIAFGEYTDVDILNNFCVNDDYATVARIFSIMSLIFVIPVQCFVLREILHVVLNRYFHRETKTDRNKFLEHIIITLIILLVSLGLSLISYCLNIIAEISGGVLGCFAAFILPTVCYIKVAKHEVFHKDNVISFLVLFVSIIIIVSTVYGITNELIDGVKCQGNTEIFYCRVNNSNHNSFNVTKNLTSY